MGDDTIIFQLATHYLPKIALRLECLFLTIEQACEESHPVIHHYALKNIIEINVVIALSGLLPEHVAYMSKSSILFK